MASPSRPGAVASGPHVPLALDPAEELTSGGFGSIIAASAGNRTAFAWTPDGQTLVFSGRRGGVQQLYVRKLQDKVARPLPGTEDAQVFAVSSDGKAVAFWAARTIRRVPLNGGPVAMLVRDIASPEGLDLGPGGRLVYAFNRLIWQVDSGNAPKVLVPIKPRESRHVLPRWLPDGTTVLFTVRYADYSWGREQVVALKSGASQPTVLLEDAADARYVPTGHLVFLRRGQLMAIPFDPVRLTVNGDAVPVLDGVAQALLGSNYRSISGAGQFAVSSAGTWPMCRRIQHFGRPQPSPRWIARDA